MNTSHFQERARFSAPCGQQYRKLGVPTKDFQSSIVAPLHQPGVIATRLEDEVHQVQVVQAGICH